MDWPVLIGASHDGWAGMSRRAPGTRRALVISDSRYFFAQTSRALTAAFGSVPQVAPFSLALASTAPPTHMALTIASSEPHSAIVLVDTSTRSAVPESPFSPFSPRSPCGRSGPARRDRPSRRRRLPSALARQVLPVRVALRALIALRAGGADRTRIPFGPGGRPGRHRPSGRRHRPDPHRPSARRTGRADVALRARYALRSAFALRSRRSGGPVSPSARHSPLAPWWPARPAVLVDLRDLRTAREKQNCHHGRDRQLKTHGLPPSAACRIALYRWMPDCPPFYAPPGSLHELVL